MARKEKTIAERLREQRSSAGDNGKRRDPPQAEDIAPAPLWPNPLAAEAYHGLAGDIVRAIEPASEADPAALLVQLLIGYGSMLGRTAHFRAEEDQHFLNEYTVLVGQTSKARKGSSWGRISRLLTEADGEWAEERVQTGLSSGEGVIHAVRDPVMGKEKLKEKGKVVSEREVEVEPGVTDKRLLVYEPEFASVLKHTDRQGNTLSPILRQAWDSGRLRTLTKHSPTRATGAHVSLIGHVTAEELRRYLTATEQANGLANRFLWLCVRRSKVLPEGGRVDPDTLAPLQTSLAEALAFGRAAGELRRDTEARDLWVKVYGELSEGKPGLAGAMLGRAEAHVMRLACLYAVLDCSPEIRPPHLLAALGLWDYCEQSVRHVFGDSTGDPVADEILRLLRGAKNQGLSRTELRDAFGRNQSGERLGQALGLLLESKLARFERVPTDGRPAERWYSASK